MHDNQSDIAVRPRSTDLLWGAFFFLAFGFVALMLIAFFVASNFDSDHERMEAEMSRQGFD